MTVIARLVTSVALGCVLASSVIAPVTGSSSSSEVTVRHAKKSHHNKSAALASRGKHTKKRASGKPGKSGHCGARLASTTTTSAQPSSTPSPAAAPKHPAAPSGNQGSGSVTNGAKPGLSWTNNWIDQKPFLEGASWCYNWGCSTDCSAPTGGQLLYIPMFWCTKTIPDWQQYVMGKSWQAILGHNEPNIGGQCNLSPGAAISQWWQYIEPVDAKVKASPAVTTGSDGLNWLKSFVSGCNGCQIDVIAIHHYALTTASFIEQANDFHAAFPDKPIWVTEIGCQDYSGNNEYCTDDMAWAMVSGVKAFIDSTDWIQKWAWYQFAEETNIDYSNSLMTSSGGITPLAELFLGRTS